MKDYEEKLINQIQNYLDDKTYNYAVLLNGDWGVGKTFFVKNKMLPVLEENNSLSIKYISLFGCNSGSDVKRIIIEKIIGDFMRKNDPIEKEIDKKWHGSKKKKIKNGIHTGSAILNDILMFFISNNQVGKGVFDIVKKRVTNIDLSKYFLVIDDIERCLCNPSELLGALNDLVEHESVKMLIIANEREVGGYYGNENLELRYLVAANSKIITSIDETIKDSYPLDILENRKNEIFNRNLITDYYMQIREKLIGYVIDYEPKLTDILHSIISSSDCPKELEDILDSQVNFFMSFMKNHKYQNLRTFQFFISKAKDLYKLLKDVNPENIDMNAFQKDLIEQCFIESFIFQIGQDFKDDQEFDGRKNLMFLRKFIKEGLLSTDEAEDELRIYITINYQNEILPNDPLNEIKDNWRKHDQKWFEEKMQEIHERLRNNQYSLYQYYNILGFASTNFLISNFPQYAINVYHTMVNNLKEISEYFTELDPYYDENVVNTETIEEKMRELNVKMELLIEPYMDDEKSKELKKLLNEHDWLDQLKKYLINYKSHPYVSPIGRIFNESNINAWKDCLLLARAGDIFEFQNILMNNDSLLTSLDIKEVYNLKELAGKIEEDINTISDSDIIKIYNLNELCMCLKNIED